MAQRYVWSKWNKIYKAYCPSVSSVGAYLYRTTQKTLSVYRGYKYVVNADGTLNLESDITHYNLNGVNSVRLNTNDYMGVGSSTNLTELYGNNCTIGFDPGMGLVVKEDISSTISTRSSKGSTSYGNISSASSGAYPSNGASGNYWYVLKGNDCIDPSAVSYSTPAPKGGEMIDVTVTPGTNTYGGTVSYKYEYSLDGSTWAVANSGTTSTTVSILIPAGSTQFQARVTASDDMGFTSPDAITGTALTVTNNTAPVITCDLSALGDITAAFNVAYSVSDADGNTMTITEALDGTAFNTFTTTGGNQTLTIDADRLLRALNGAHTLTITVDDGNGGVTTHSITFTKAVYTATITRAEPMDADDRIAIMVMHVVGSIPADADYKVEVTNNALDASPVWEDVTSYIKNDNIKNYSFANTTCTSGTWAFNFRVTVSRGSSGVGGYITSLDGAFEGSVA